MSGVILSFRSLSLPYIQLNAVLISHSQSQTALRKCSMLTFLLCISIIQGCSSIRQGVARREASFSRLVELVRNMFLHSKITGRREKTQENIPAFNKVLECFTPFDQMLRFVFQLWNRLPYDIREKIEQAGFRLYLGTIRREWKAMLSNFKEGDA